MQQLVICHCRKPLNWISSACGVCGTRPADLMSDVALRD